jgi:hypothetical protein
MHRARRSRRPVTAPQRCISLLDHSPAKSLWSLYVPKSGEIQATSQTSILKKTFSSSNPPGPARHVRSLPKTSCFSMKLRDFRDLRTLRGVYAAPRAERCRFLNRISGRSLGRSHSNLRLGTWWCAETGSILSKTGSIVCRCQLVTQMRSVGMSAFAPLAGVERTLVRDAGRWRFMSTRPSTTLADLERDGIPKSVFL